MNAKTSKPDRKRNDRGGRREPSEFSEATLSVDRVTRVVKGGRRMRFRAIVVVGNKKGKVGLGTGKATEVQVAIKKAVSAAKRAMIRVPMKNGTIPHAVELKFKAARLRLMPAMPGTGVIAGGALRVILEQAGVTDVLSKRFGSRNKLVNAQTSIMVLQKLKQVAGFMPDEKPVVVAADGAPETEVDKSKPVVTEISKGEAQKRVDEARRSKVDDK